MPEITGMLGRGNAALTSYSLEWNAGSGTAFTTLSGVPDDLNR
jgi:hypothetical protein